MTAGTVPTGIGAMEPGTCAVITPGFGTVDESGMTTMAALGFGISTVGKRDGTVATGLLTVATAVSVGVLSDAAAVEVGLTVEKVWPSVALSMRRAYHD